MSYEYAKSLVLKTAAGMKKKQTPPRKRWMLRHSDFRNVINKVTKDVTTKPIGKREFTIPLLRYDGKVIFKITIGAFGSPAEGVSRYTIECRALGINHGWRDSAFHVIGNGYALISQVVRKYEENTFGSALG